MRSIIPIHASSVCGVIHDSATQAIGADAAHSRSDAFAAEHEDERWDKVIESIDLLYAKMEVMDQQQQCVATQVDVGNKVMEQLLKDQ